MQVQNAIMAKLAEFSPVHLDVINESHMHSVPENSETHFKVIVIADCFDGQSRVARHQAVNAALSEELAGPVHALSIQAYTPAEWEKRGETVPASPQCLGGGKFDIPP